MSDMVKALEWHNFDAWTWWAEAVCGTYHVEERNGGWRVELRFHDARHIITETDDFDGAIVAAQSDYTARILAALDLSAVEALQAENARLRSILGRIKDETLNGASYGLGDRIYDLACLGLAVGGTDGQ